MVTCPARTPSGPGDLFVTGGRVLDPGGRLVRADVEVRGGRITGVGPPPPGGAAAPASGPAARLPVLDAAGTVVAPGLVDLQCNGAGGIDLAAEPERLWEVAGLLPRWGVTAWLPTIVSCPAAVRERARETLAAPPSGPAGATPLGLHLEGPFLAPERRGAHAREHLRPPDSELVEGWSPDGGVALVTLAPELPGALEVVSALVERGVVVSAGHSSAGYQEARAGVDAGIRGVTHVFNAMAPLHHRDPGLAGVALTDERVAVGLVADGVHVHPAVVGLVARAVGQRLVLVTDAVAALGQPPGRARLAGAEVTADGRSVRLADGTLAGSVLSLDRAVAGARELAGLSLAAAVEAASAAPARLLGLGTTRGVVVTGAVGDLVLLDGTGVAATVVAGRVAHRRAPGAGPNG